MILLINAPVPRRRRLEDRTGVLPYGTGVLVAALRAHDYEARHVDLSNPRLALDLNDLGETDFERWLRHDDQTPAMGTFLAGCRELLGEMGGVPLVGLSVLSHLSYPFALALAKAIRHASPETVLCLGGAFVSVRQLTVPPWIDFWVKGTGRAPLLHLAEHVVRGAALDPACPGLGHRLAGTPRENGRQDEAADLEPAPDFSDLRLTDYESRDPRRPGCPRLVVPYRTSFGCANRCTFCTGRKAARFRVKAPEKIVEELEELTRLHANVHLWFCDASINSSPRTIRSALAALTERGRRIPWSAFCKVHNLDAELVALFARSGCERLGWGLDGVSPRMNAVFDKRFDLATAERLIAQAAEAGIDNVVSMIHGGPGEREEDLTLLTDLARRLIRLPRTEVRLFAFGLEEGALIFDEPRRFGIEILSRPDPADYLGRAFADWREEDTPTALFRARRSAGADRIDLLRYELALARALRDSRLGAAPAGPLLQRLLSRSAGTLRPLYGRYRQARRALSGD